MVKPTAKRPATVGVEHSCVEHPILESISDGVFTVDGNWRITYFNRAAESITGVSRAEALGRTCAEVFRASMCEGDCALRRTLETGSPIVNRSAFIVDARGRRIPISVSTAILRDAKGRVAGGAETFRDLSVVEELQRELQGRFRMGDLVSRSPAMRQVFELIPLVAATDSTVLIQGDTGTGKELVARAIHGASNRKNRPFVAVNCGALPDTLLESELFGYKAGAFTGARKDKPGRFALADGGTLFLDEIGEVSPALQVRLLRVLQERVYEPLGGTRPVRANVRVIAATNRDLADRVRQGEFRQELFYRVNVVTIHLPPLRKRKEDIPLLVDRFVERFNRIQGKRVSGVGRDAMGLIMAHDWPGNVRELENVIERAFVLCGNGEIGTDHLPEAFQGHNPATVAPEGRDMDSSLRAAEAQAIRDALRRQGGNRLAAAKELGLHKSTLFRKIKALDIECPETDGRTCRLKSSRAGSP